MKFQKRVSLGQFLKKGTDIRDGDIITIGSEGKQVQGEFGEQNIFLVQLKDGREGNVSFNTTSVNNMIDCYGEESRNWIGKQAKVWGIRSNVQGKMIVVYYFSHPDAILDDEGVFALPANNKKLKDEEIPIVEDEEIEDKENFEKTFGK